MKRNRKFWLAEYAKVFKRDNGFTKDGLRYLVWLAKDIWEES